MYGMRELLQEHLRENAKLEQLFDYFTTYQWDLAPQDSENLQQQIDQLSEDINARYRHLQHIFYEIPVTDILQMALLEEHNYGGTCTTLMLELLFATHFGAILHGDLRVLADHLEWDWFTERIHEMEQTLQISLSYEKQSLLGKLQVMRAIALDKYQERVLATMMGFHPRLGSDSSLSDIEPRIMSDHVFSDENDV